MDKDLRLIIICNIISAATFNSSITIIKLILNIPSDPSDTFRRFNSKILYFLKVGFHKKITR